MRRITIIMLLVAILAVVGCNTNKCVNNEPLTVADPCKELATEAEINACYLELGRESQILHICDELTDNNLKENCYMQLISGRLDINCDQFEGNIRDRCYLALSMKSGEEILCDRIIGLNTRDQCYFNLLAHPRIEVGMCEKIINPDIKGECTAKFKD